MNPIYKAIKDECRKVIIATNGNPLNRDVTPIINKFKPICGLDAVTHVQNAMSYFRFSPTQAKFRQAYNYCING